MKPYHFLLAGIVFLNIGGCDYYEEQFSDDTSESSSNVEDNQNTGDGDVASQGADVGGDTDTATDNSDTDNTDTDTESSGPDGSPDTGENTETVAAPAPANPVGAVDNATSEAQSALSTALLVSSLSDQLSTDVYLQARSDDNSDLVDRAEAELLLNGSFDRGLQSWQTCDTGVDADRESAVEATITVEGELSVLIENHCIYQTILVAPGERLSVLCQARNVDTQFWSGGGVNFSDPQRRALSTGPVSFNVLADLERSYKRTFQAPPGAHYASLWLSSTGEMEVSDCRLYSDPFVEPPGTLVFESNESADEDDSYLDDLAWTSCSTAVAEFDQYSDGSMATGAGFTCLYQTIATSTNDEWVFSCEAQTSGDYYAEVVLSTVDKNWQVTQQAVSAVGQDATQHVVELVADTSARFVMPVLYSEGATDFNHCTLTQENDITLPPPPPGSTFNFSLSLSEADVRFINQATFGATLLLISELKTISYAQWIDRQLITPSVDDYVDEVNAFYDAFPNRNLPRPDNVIGTKSQAYNPMPNIMMRSWIESTDQLRKRMAAALVEIMVINDNVSQVGSRPKSLMAASYMHMLEQHAFGNFRDLLQAVTLHPAMGEFLTYAGNAKAEYDEQGHVLQAPDENYAREILQLFTIGLHELHLNGEPRLENGQTIETYDQDDVVNLARVFTGWDLNRSPDITRIDKYIQPMVLTASRHAPEEKVFLDARIPAGTDGEASLQIALDTLFNHPNVGPFIAKQLIQRFVTSNPSSEYVERVAQVFNADERGVRGNLGAVIKAILLDSEARAGDGQGVDFHASDHFGKFREPMFRLTALARALQVNTDRLVYPVGTTNSIRSGLGQTPLQSTDVFNFFRPGFTPGSSALADNGMVAPEAQIISGSATLGYVTFLDRMFASIEDGFSVHYAQLAQFATRPALLVDLLNKVLTAGTMQQQSIDEAVAALESIDIGEIQQRVDAALVLVAMSPAFIIQK